MKIVKLITYLTCIIFLSSCAKLDNLFHNDDDENERSIKISELPDAVLSAINEDYPGAQLLEADEITHPDNSLTYDVEMKFEGAVIEVMYDAEGNFLGVEEDDDDGDEDGDDESDDD
ncbi:MAG: hypothetical protein ACKVPJ_03655 [Chitinophagales bacterium]